MVVDQSLVHEFVTFVWFSSSFNKIQLTTKHKKNSKMLINEYIMLNNFELHWFYVDFDGSIKLYMVYIIVYILI